jgi:hypothetical protein
MTPVGAARKQPRTTGGAIQVPTRESFCQVMRTLGAQCEYLCRTGDLQATNTLLALLIAMCQSAELFDTS